MAVLLKIMNTLMLMDIAKHCVHVKPSLLCKMFLWLPQDMNLSNSHFSYQLSDGIACQKYLPMRYMYNVPHTFLAKGSYKMGISSNSTWLLNLHFKPNGLAVIKHKLPPFAYCMADPTVELQRGLTLSTKRQITEIS